MKKIKFLFVLALLFLAASPAFALQCKEGQSINGDECWTSVKVSLLETNVVSAGSILIYDINTGDIERGAYEVVLATASLDDYRIAGVAQQTIATGDWGKVLVKGKGLVIMRDVAASGDRIYVSSIEGKGGTTGGRAADGTNRISSADPIGFLLEASTADATHDAYITILG